jgi:hypothetical protein
MSYIVILMSFTAIFPSIGYDLLDMTFHLCQTASNEKSSADGYHYPVDSVDSAIWLLSGGSI